MLKLEKNSAEIHISFREKEKFFNSLFLKALAAALFFHFIFLLVFQIQPFKTDSTFLFPPVKVETEFASEAILQKEDEELAMLTPPPYGLISVKKTPQDLMLHSSMESLPELISAESMILTSLSPPTVEVPKVQIFVSGDLANQAWTLPGKIEKAHVALDADPLFVKYRVQADENKGEIFWFELLKSSGSVFVDRQAEKMLLHLQFNPGKDLANLNGVIDFVIYGESS